MKQRYRKIYTIIVTILALVVVIPVGFLIYGHEHLVQYYEWAADDSNQYNNETVVISIVPFDP